MGTVGVAAPEAALAQLVPVALLAPPKEGPSNTAVGSFSTSRRNWSNFGNIMTPLESEIWEKISEETARTSGDS
ncbi:hypothetical protein EYF80_004763 [Liparis tanakae]|uniref:Uncharacterized protein n=1 Tax=Liparis tanakae TaxID=230148 RepID=A0A4Z2J4G8_9TELE|nr:hypothetical protein EYF80_004763 [Liparis tanakae]